MTISNYAMVDSSTNIVANTIVADENFKISGYTMILMADGVFCQIGMYYNSADGKFYDDSTLATINGVSVTTSDSSTTDSSTTTDTTDTTTDASTTSTDTSSSS